MSVCRIPHELSSKCAEHLSSLVWNYDSKWQPVMLSLLTVTENAFLILHRFPKCQKLPLNRLPKQTDRVLRPPSWINLCMVRVTWWVCSTSETALLFSSLKFAGFHNQSPLLTMFYLMVFNRNTSGSLGECQNIVGWGNMNDRQVFEQLFWVHQYL